MVQPVETEHRQRLHAALGEVDALMSRAVYDALFDMVATHRPARILEIGTAHGAGTIAMALGAGSVDAPTRIQTVDTLQILPDIPSSRAVYGDAEANEAIVRRNFRSAGVEDRVALHVGRSDEFAAGLPDGFSIDMLMLDADGRIDRDLLLFSGCMTPDCLVVIDDIDGAVSASVRRGGLAIDLKHVISAKLSARLVEIGYLAFETRVENTSFFRAVEPAEWDPDRLRDVALSCYRELVFTQARLVPIMVASLAALLSSTPILRPVYRVTRSGYRRLTGRGRPA